MMAISSEWRCFHRFHIGVIIMLYTTATYREAIVQLPCRSKVTHNIFWPRKTRWWYMCVLMNVRVCVEGWCICNVWWRHGNVWLPGGMAPKSVYVDFKCKTIPWIYPLKSKPIPVQFTPNISQCVYVYILISWTQEDAPWLVRKGEVWGVPCDFIICRKKHIFPSYCVITEARVSSFWWGLRHWLHWSLSKCQLSVRPEVGISSEWRRFCLEVIIMICTTAVLTNIYWMYSTVYES